MKSNTSTVLSLLMLSFMISSCSAITGIFKAGMGFGIFIVIAVILVIVFIAMRSKRK